MSKHLNKTFIQQQRQRLETLRAQILDTESGAEQPQDIDASGVKDSGEQGASEAQRRRRQALDANARGQLNDIRRALEKIDEGSYGYSDESDEPIPQARLEVMPQANLTVEEEGEREQRLAVEGRLDS